MHANILGTSKAIARKADGTTATAHNLVLSLNSISSCFRDIAL